MAATLTPSPALARGVASSDDLLAVRVAELYYDQNRTQDEIGAELGLTRWKVGRVLAAARERGIVRIEIVHPRARRGALEVALRERFRLNDVIVVPAAPAEIAARVAQAAADYLSRRFSPAGTPVTLGVSWGRTIDAVADHLESGWADGATVVQVNGGASRGSRPGTAAATAVAIAVKGGGEAVLLPIPAILERAQTRRAIESDRAVSGVLQLAARASVYLYSAGVANENSVLVDSGYLSAQDVAALVERGAVGDVVGRYIDASGTIVDPGLDDRTLGIELDRLRSAETAIFVVGGADKHEVARAVVANGLCTVLVTDEATAQALLAESSSPSIPRETP